MKYMIINGNAMNGKKTFGSTRNMHKNSEMIFSMRDFNNRVTNVTNLHTFSTRSVDMILTAILLAHGHLFQLTGDVVSGTTIHIPVCVDAVGTICCGNNFLILRGLTIFIKAIPTVPRRVPQLATNLAAHGVRL